MAKRVTMQQIADYCGVSKFVVSKALSGKGGVSGTTKARVMQAASQLGYFAQKNAYVKQMKPDSPQAASSTARQSVLVLMPNIRFQTTESLYWGKIWNGISESLEKAGLGNVIISEQSTESFLHVFNPSGILGLIGVGEISSSLLLEVHRLGLPMVLVDHEDPLIPIDSVFVNNYDCMNRLTKHLIGIGHRSLQFIGNVHYSKSFHDRWLGFRSALEEHGVEVRESLLLNLEGMDHYRDQIKAWAAGKKKAKALPTVLVCANDSIAMDAIHALRELDIAVPEEVSVTGFDNIDDALRMKPALTTVHVPKETLGERAVDKLLERSRKKESPAEKWLIAGEVLYRDSMAEARK